MLRENKRNVTVITASVHRDQEGEQEYREIRAKGQLSEREGVLYVLYEEEMEGAERPVKNFLKIEPSPLRVSIKKSGGVCWKAVFEKGMRHEADYRTPY